MLSIRPLRSASAWMTTPEYSSGTSIDTRSTGSCSLPATVRVTTCGLPIVSSNPSRRIISASTANCISPRPCTSHVSGRSVGSTRRPTLPSSSRSSRSWIIRAVSLVPLWPASGPVLVATVTDRLGSSITIRGSRCGSSGSAIVSPIITSSRPATAMISPGARPLGRDAIEALGDEQLGQLGAGDRAVLAAPCDGRAARDLAVADAAEREPAEVAATRRGSRPAPGRGASGRRSAPGCSRRSGRTAAGCPRPATSGSSVAVPALALV